MKTAQLQLRRIRIAGVLAAAMAVIAVLFLPSAASAQSPAFCLQYPDSPLCLGDVGPGGGDGAFDPDAGPGFGPGGGGVDTGSDSGELPFTGYPLTPLLLLLLLLLLTGLTIRAYIAIRDRMRTKYAAGGPVQPL